MKRKKHCFDEDVMELVNIFINELYLTSDTDSKANKSYVVWVQKCVQMINTKIVEILYNKDSVIDKFEQGCREELANIEGGEEESTT